MAQKHRRTTKKDPTVKQKKLENRRNAQKKIDVNLEKLKDFNIEFKTPNRHLKCLFINGYNHFYSAFILGKKGLRCQSFNCLRFGLESIWLGLVLQKSPLLTAHWTFGTGDEETRKNIKKLEGPKSLRKELGEEGRLKIQDRHDIYSALSDKSHTKLASIAVLTMNNDHDYDNSVECIPMEGLIGDFNVAKTLQAVDFVLNVALAEIEDYLGYGFFEDKWKYNRMDIIHISQQAYGDKKRATDPHISSHNHPGRDGIQAAALLSTIRSGRI